MQAQPEFTPQKKDDSEAVRLDQGSLPKAEGLPTASEAAEAQPSAHAGQPAAAGGSPQSSDQQAIDHQTGDQHTGDQQPQSTGPAQSDGTTLTLSIGQAQAILEHRAKAQGVVIEDLKERARLDGCLATDSLEVFHLVNIYFGDGKLHDDGKPRPMVALGADAPFAIETVWELAAAQLGRREDDPLAPKQYFDQFIAGRSAADPHRGTEPLHVSLWLSPISMLKDPQGDGQRFKESLNELLLDHLDKLNEEYKITFSIFCPAARHVIPEDLQDIVVQTR